MGILRYSGAGNKDLGDSLEEDNDSEGGGGVVGKFSGFVKNHLIRFLKGCWMMAKAEEGAE